MTRYVLLILGVLLVWLTHAWGGPSEGVADFDRLRADGEQATGKVVELQERTVRQGRRRSSGTRTEHCPVVSYLPEGSGKGRERRFTEYDDCDGWAVGDEVPVVYDAGDNIAHIASDEVRESLASSERTYRWAPWLGYGLVAVMSTVIIVGWWRRWRRRTPPRAS